MRECRVYYEGFGVTAPEIDRNAPALRHIGDVCAPALRKLLSQLPPEPGD